MSKFINEKNIRQFRNYGYTKIEDVLNKNDLNFIKKSIRNISNKYINFDCNNLNNKEFNNKLIHLRKNNSAKFSSLYDTMQSSIALKRIISSNKILQCVEKILSTNKEDITTTGETIRLDPPHDDRNSYDWHQERSYYPNNRNGKNGIFCWVPLHDISKNMGPLTICPKSHKEKFIFTEKKKISKGGSIDIKVPSKLVDKYKAKIIPIEEGSIILAHMHLFHKSGKNVSKQFRFSFVARYHIGTSEDYLPGMKINTKWNSYEKNKFKKFGDTLSDL